MNALSALHHYGHGHGGSGWSHLLTTIAHAAIWSTVGRMIWHAPALAVLVAFGAAAAYLLASRRKRCRPSGSPDA
jgi:hypothetical protein